MPKIKIMWKRKQNILMFAVACVLFVFFLIISIFFVYLLINHNEGQTIDYMESISKGRRSAVYQLIEGDLQFLRGLATATPFISMSSDIQIKELFDEVNSSDHFVRMGLIDADGMGYFVNPDGTTISNLDLSGYNFFQKAIEGDASVSETFYDELTEQDINYYAVPIMSSGDNEVQYVLCAVSSSEILLKILNDPVGQDEGYFVLVNSEGIIVSPVPDTVSIVQTGTHIFDIAKFEQAETLSHALQTETNGNFEMEASILYHRIVLEPLNINGWSILGVVSQQTIDLYYNITSVVVILIVLETCILLLMYWQLRQFSRSNQTLEQLAYSDPLTGARNYTKFLLDAQVLLQKPSDKKYAIWSTDLKNFRLINIIFGNALGDQVIKRIATLLEEEEGENGVFCRISADRFVGIRAYGEKRELEEWFRYLGTRLADRKVLSANRVDSGGAMGFYCLEDFEVHPAVEEMVNNAAIAKNVAKAQMGSQTCFFTSEMGEQAQREIELEANGRMALQRGEITFFVQPKVTIQNGFSIVGGEVLMRWQHPTIGWISPGEFLPVFENNGFIVEVDRYIFEQACAWYADCSIQGIPAFQLSINVSRQGLLRNDFSDYYASVKEKYGISDGVLELEFTESTPLDNYELFHNLAVELQKRGFTCSIDDFGSGYSSLKVFKDLPINVLKLDAAFFQKDGSSPKEEIVVSDFINTAQKLHIKVVAEGIENAAQVRFLQNVGCDMIQGYIFCKPVSQETFIDMFTKAGGRVEMQQTMSD